MVEAALTYPVPVATGEQAVSRLGSDSVGGESGKEKN
jgi:hypothetical protein